MLELDPQLILLCIELDPWQETTGGQTAFAKHLLQTFPTRFAVVSSTPEDLPAGKWCERKWHGQSIKFFSLGSVRRAGRCKPLVPQRASLYWMARRHMAALNASGSDSILIDNPEVLLAASHYSWRRACYLFSSINNQISNSRYKWARPFGPLFENLTVAALRRLNPEVVVAAADDCAITELYKRTRGNLNQFKIHSLPTRVDLSRFYPEERLTCRKRCGLPADELILICTGRLCWIKGWAFLIDVLAELRRRAVSATLVLVGSGEDHDAALRRAELLGLAANVLVTGFLRHDQVRTFLNAADVYVVGSFLEGWSVAMVEALACGKRIVSTAVSGATGMVSQGTNGFIVASRDPASFADAVMKSLALSDAAEYSINLSRHYSLQTLRSDLSRIWDVLR